MPVQTLAEESTPPVSVTVGNRSFDVQKTGISGYTLDADPITLPIYKVTVPTDSDIVLSTADSAVVAIADETYVYSADLSAADHSVTVPTSKQSNYIVRYYETSDKFYPGFLNRLVLDDQSITDIVDTAKTVLYIEFSSDLNNFIGEFGLLIQLGESHPNSDKTALSTAISAAPTTQDDTYYHQNDRYNGKAASENGFWADFQTALTAAETVNDDASVSQKQVDAATTVLTTAIDDLIPTAQINATKLYEALKNAQDLVWLSGTAIPRPDGWTGEDSLVVTKSTTSVITWSPYQAALTDGRSLLDSLFDEDGTPTAANTSTDTALAQQVDDQAAAIDDAVAALDSRTDEAGVSRSETALAGIDLYANTLYNTDYLAEPGYTADSWKTFIETRDAALDVLKDGKSFTGMGDRVVKAQQQAFAELRAACYGLVNAGSTITVHFSAVDNYAVRKEKTSMAVNTCDLVLNAGATVADALDAADVSPDTDYKLYSAVEYYLNGISYVNTPDATVQATAADVKLRDGDTLVVALEAPPTYTNASGTEAIDRDVLPSYETITVPSSAVPAGEHGLCSCDGGCGYRCRQGRTERYADHACKKVFREFLHQCRLAVHPGGRSYRARRH